MNTRNTHQKEIIQNIMQGIGVHKKAEEILLEAKKEDASIGLATIYRNLNRLVEEGKIQKVEGNYYDANPLPHDHFVCVECGKVMDVDSVYDSSLDELVSRQAHAKIMKHSTTYQGICEDCQKRHEGENYGTKRKQNRS